MNLIVCEKNNNRISYFVKNAIKKGNDIFGDNIKLAGMKDKTWDFIWTEDEVESSIENETLKYAKNRTEVKAIERKQEIAVITKDDVKNLMSLVEMKKLLTPDEMDFCIKAIGAFLLTELKLEGKA